MTHLQDPMLDIFYIKELANPGWAKTVASECILPDNIIGKVFQQLLRLLRSDAVQKVLNIVQRYPKVKTFAKLIPPLLALAALFATKSARSLNIASILAPLVVELGCELKRLAKNFAKKNIFGAVWDVLMTTVRQLDWTLLWNPWIIAGIVSIATAIWILFRAYGDQISRFFGGE